MNNTALVTGASSGIGRELARLLARDGHDLVLVARSEARLNAVAEELRQQHGVEIRVLAADLAQPDAPRAIHEVLAQEQIAVDLLVNNAGTQVYGEFAGADGAALLEMIQVNLTSLTHLTRLIVPDMVARGRGQILNVGSIGSFLPGPLTAVYNATKAYVLSLSQALAAELIPSGITVTALCPGATDTLFVTRHGMQNARIFEHMVSPKAVAEVGLRALKQGRRVVVPGRLQLAAMAFTGLLVPFVPTGLLRRIGFHILGESNPRPTAPRPTAS